MSRLVSFLSALWLSSAAHFVSTQDTTNAANGTGLDNIGNGLCANVKRILGVAYDDFDIVEPDMSKLTLVYVNKSNETFTFYLTEASTVLPKEEWFDPECRMIVYMHGFTDNPQKSSFQKLRQAVETGRGTCVNILALDASSLISFFYLRATTMVMLIGRVLGTVLAALISAGLNPSKIHLIGHSLGAHISGSAGKMVFSSTGSKVGRITALDPAGPCFGNVDPTLSLIKDDADFVDVIHTDAGVYGWGQTIGHVDFWVNGGSQQPGCLLQTCSHSRSWEYFAESVDSPAAFLAVKCNSFYDFRQGKCDMTKMSFMGYYTSTNITGDYFLTTSSESPFGTGAMGTTYASSSYLTGITYAIKDFFRNFWQKFTRSN